jgi:hypothetical protein
MKLCIVDQNKYLSEQVLTFTLDTNCLVAVDELRPEKSAIDQLIAAHNENRAEVGIVAISASERQKGGGLLENFCLFQDRIKHLGMDGLKLLEPMFYWDISFLDFSLWVDDEMLDLEKKIHEILFPKVEFDWIDYAKARDLDPDSLITEKRWRNAKCDVQAFWSHAFRKRTVFVSSDKNFHASTKKPLLLALAGGRIEYPENAAELLKV